MVQNVDEAIGKSRIKTEICRNSQNLFILKNMLNMLNEIISKNDNLMTRARDYNTFLKLRKT